MVYSVALHGLRRSFSSLAEWTEIPRSIKAQIMGHKPSAIAERHYNVRPLEGRDSRTGGREDADNPIDHGAHGKRTHDAVTAHAVALHRSDGKRRWRPAAYVKELDYLGWPIKREWVKEATYPRAVKCCWLDPKTIMAVRAMRGAALLPMLSHGDLPPRTWRPHLDALRAARQGCIADRTDGPENSVSKSRPTMAGFSVDGWHPKNMGFRQSARFTPSQATGTGDGRH